MTRFSDEWVLQRTLYEIMPHAMGSGAMCGCFFPLAATSTTSDRPLGLSMLSALAMDAARADCDDLSDSGDDPDGSALRPRIFGKAGQGRRPDPWPQSGMRDDVWEGRVKIRRALRSDAAAMMGRLVGSADGGGVPFPADPDDIFRRVSGRLRGWAAGGGADGAGGSEGDKERVARKLRDIFQSKPLTIGNFMKLLRERYGTGKIYSTDQSTHESLMMVVADQVANFNLTKYEQDGRHPSELAFESCLSFTERSPSPSNVQTSWIDPDNKDMSEDSGFIFPITVETKRSDGTGEIYVSERHLQIMLDVLGHLCHVAFGLSKILSRLRDGPENSGGNSHDTAPHGVGRHRKALLRKKRAMLGEDFRGERRIVRMVCALHWVGELLEAFDSDIR